MIGPISHGDERDSHLCERTRDPMNCLHTKTARGKNAPRAWGSWRTQICLDCGAFRLHAQDEDPRAAPGWSKSAWRPASEYEVATSKVQAWG